MAFFMPKIRKATVKKQWLEELIIREIKRFLDDPDTMEAVTELVVELQGRDSLSCFGL